MSKEIEARIERKNPSKTYSLDSKGIRRMAKEAGIRNVKGMEVLIINNYDSFTFNLYQFVGEILQDANKDAFKVEVVRNDKITLDQIKQGKYNRIIISPGPGDPSDDAYFGVCGKVLTELGKTTPVLGVCLGMQGMAYHFGGKVIRAQVPMHGKTSIIEHDGKGVFTGIPQDLEVMRYHSLVADKKTLPESLEITAQVRQVNGEIMGLRHKTHKVEGIQFHPESIGTQKGKEILANFIFQK